MRYVLALCALLFVGCGSAADAFVAKHADQIEAAYERANNAVVGLMDEHGNIRCTGFLIEDGSVVTAAHCIEAGLSRIGYYAAFDRSHNKFTAYDTFKIKLADPRRDVAVLTPLGGYRHWFPLANRNAYRGEPVFFIGHPITVGYALEPGVVSVPLVYDGGVPLIHSTPPLAPGGSGGPLLSYDGEVLGMAVFVLEGSKGNSLGFYVHVAAIRTVLEDK